MPLRLTWASETPPLENVEPGNALSSRATVAKGEWRLQIFISSTEPASTGGKAPAENAWPSILELGIGMVILPRKRRRKMMAVVTTMARTMSAVGGDDDDDDDDDDDVDVDVDVDDDDDDDDGDVDHYDGGGDDDDDDGGDE